MAKKKSRRSRRKATARRKTQTTTQAKAQAIPSTPRAKAAPRRSEYTKAKVDFAEEYRYVLQDLRRLAILAASIFIALVALSFVLR